MEEAKEKQFELMEAVCTHFGGNQLLQADLGVTPEWGRPETTKKVEEVLAEFFDAEACALVQGAGTGAIRAMLDASVYPGDRLLVHDAPQYSTSAHTLESKGMHLVRIDLNHLEEFPSSLERSALPSCALVQHSRQRPEDSYELIGVVEGLKSAGVRVMTDENYTALKVPEIGAEVGAEASAFSLFKLLGPEGLGCVVGRERLVSNIHSANYSGGSQVQGHQALEALRSLVLVPLIWALQAEVVDEVAERLREGEVQGVADARVVNGQDRMVMILFEEPIARSVVESSARFGAQNYPVGANSRHEIAPLFYRLSGSFLQSRRQLAEYSIRINPVRAGANLVVSILRESVEAARCS